MPFRQNKISSLIQHHVAEFVRREAGENSLITITSVDVSGDLKNAVIKFTTLPQDKEDDALNFLKRKRSDFRRYFKSVSVLGALPHIDFEIDRGEHNRQRIDEIGDSEES